MLNGTRRTPPEPPRADGPPHTEVQESPMESRAYSFIQIKAVDEENRIIDGIATTPSPDRVGDIVQPMGAKYRLPLPFLWQHNHEEPIGHVIEATPTPQGIAFRAQIAKTDEPGKLQDLLNFAWQCIKMKLVAAVSIGFRPIKYAFLTDGGVEFEEWDWYELSAVTIPAQAEATITAVKSIDAGLRKAAGIAEPEIPQPDTSAALGTGRVVKLDEPARDRAKPFVINRILRSGQES
jgi:HK97 family phage prohead protease